MKMFEIYNVSKRIDKNLRLFPDSVRLLVPKLLHYSNNIEDFLTLFELSKFQSNRSQILKIVRKNQSISNKFRELIKRKSNKKIKDKINNNLKKIQNNEEIGL